MRSDKLTEEDRAWLCSCSSYAKVKKPEVTVMATSDVAIMLHNLRFEIEELQEFRDNAFLAHPNIDLDIEAITQK